MWLYLFPSRFLWGQPSCSHPSRSWLVPSWSSHAPWEDRCNLKAPQYTVLLVCVWPFFGRFMSSYSLFILSYFTKNIKNTLMICALKSASLAHIAVASVAGDRKSSIPVFPSQRNRSPGKVHLKLATSSPMEAHVQMSGSRSVWNPRDLWRPYHSALIPISITEFRNKVQSQKRQVLWYRVCSILWETALHGWEQSQKEPLHIPSLAN